MHFYKQTNECAMGGSLSEILYDTYVTKMEKDVVLPSQPTFYERYVEDMFKKRKKNILSPDKFLESTGIIDDVVRNKKVCRKSTKLTISCRRVFRIFLGWFALKIFHFLLQILFHLAIFL